MAAAVPPPGLQPGPGGLLQFLDVLRRRGAGGHQSLELSAHLSGAHAAVFVRQLEGWERNRGIVAAIALESVVKLLAFSSVAVFAVWLLFFNPRFSESFTYLSALDPIWWEFSLDTNFITQTLLATAAIVCLPRQFHMAVVEYHDARDLNSARWFLPLYLLLFSLLILPLAICGHLLYSESGTAPDSLVLTLPMQEGFSSLTLLAFVGGFSAATGLDALEGLAQTWGELPPAVLVSADISESVRNSAHERGFHYLSKPVKPAVLRSLIRRLIRQARLRAG